MSQTRLGIPIALVFLLISTSVLATPATAGAMQGAQATGVLIGTVMDVDNAPLPDVTVTLEGESLIQRVATALTNRSGIVRFRALKPGEYVLRAALSGFRTAEYRVPVSVGRTATIHIRLELAGVEETILVTAEAPLIDPKSAQVTSSFAEQLIQNIPIAREFIDVVDITPGFADRGAYGAGADAYRSRST